MFTFALSLFFACGEKATDTAEATETTEESTDTAAESTEDTNSGSSGGYPGEESEGIGEMGGYLSSYCTQYAMRCGLYSSEEYCVDEMSSWYNSTCVIVDTDMLGTCVTWLSELSCDETGWIDECSNFYNCD